MKTARDLINFSLPPLKITDTVSKALDWMENFHLRQLPVVENAKYLGLVHEKDLLILDDSEIKIASIDFKNQSATVHSERHFFQVLKSAVDKEIEVVPVIDEDEKFLGVIAINESVLSFAQLCTFNGPGSVLILKLEEHDYSLSEISRLIELESAKIVSSFVTNNQANPTSISLTIKLNKIDSGAIVSTLERHGFNIVASYDESVKEDPEKDNFDHFMKYLDI